MNLRHDERKHTHTSFTSAMKYRAILSAVQETPLRELRVGGRAARAGRKEMSRLCVCRIQDTRVCTPVRVDLRCRRAAAVIVSQGIDTFPMYTNEKLYNDDERRYFASNFGEDCLPSLVGTGVPIKEKYSMLEVKRSRRDRDGIGFIIKARNEINDQVVARGIGVKGLRARARARYGRSNLDLELKFPSRISPGAVLCRFAKLTAR